MNSARARWIATFDMEDLISAILRNGMRLSIGLILAGVVLRWIRHQPAADTIQGANACHFLATHLHRMGSPAFLPELLIRWGIGVLLFTPYVRVAASILYFACVHRSWKHTLLGALALAPLTYILFLG